MKNVGTLKLCSRAIHLVPWFDYTTYKVSPGVWASGTDAVDSGMVTLEKGLYYERKTMRRLNLYFHVSVSWAQTSVMDSTRSRTEQLEGHLQHYQLHFTSIRPLQSLTGPPVFLLTRGI